VNQQINLYQSMFRPRKTVLSTAIIARMIVLVIVGLGAVYGYTWLQIEPIKLRAADTIAEVARSEANIKELRMRYPVPAVDAGVTRLAAQTRTTLNDTRQIVLKLRSGAFGRIEGLSVFLEGFARQHVEGTWLTQVRVRAGGRSIGLKGNSLIPDLVPAYIGRLSEEPVLRGTSFSNMEMKALPGALDVIGFSVRTSGIAADEGS
jgi:hypothetical protein